jgi:hypothetical protein
MNGYTALWITWIAMFFVVEFAALRDKKEGDTLSEHLWSWLGTDNQSGPSRKIFGATALTLFAVWFFPHILFGGQ